MLVSLKHADAKLTYLGENSGIYVQANDVRIVQLIDKLKDNALDFSLPGTEILFQLDVNQHRQVVFHVKNEGETIPQERLVCRNQLFMVMAASYLST